MKRSLARILAVTAGLVAGGALFGALAGAAALTIVLVPFGWIEGASDLILFAARMGAVLGAVLLPIAGWLLMRRVPLWRALTGTVVGTVIGGILGAVLLTFFVGPVVGPPLGAILGFFCAVIGLRRRFPAVPVPVAVSEPRRIEVPPRRLDY